MIRKSHWRCHVLETNVPTQNYHWLPRLGTRKQRLSLLGFIIVQKSKLFISYDTVWNNSADLHKYHHFSRKTNFNWDLLLGTRQGGFKPGPLGLALMKRPLNGERQYCHTFVLRIHTGRIIFSCHINQRPELMVQLRYSLLGRYSY